MKPNYKALAEQYRNRYYAEQERISALLQGQSLMAESLREKEQELDEWRSKYVQILNQYIDLQERVARKEGQG